MANEDEFDNADLCFVKERGAENETDEDEFSDSEELYPLAKGQSFMDWKDVESYFAKHGCERGFAFLLVKSELDKNDRIPQYRVYYCSKGRRFESKKKAHTLEERSKTHKNTGCEFHINFQRWKNDNQIRISGIIGKHSHQMSENIQMVASQYHCLTPEMQKDIELLATSSVHTGAIINVLTHKYPDQYIHACCVYNIVQNIKAEKGKLSNAGAAYKELMRRKQETPGWFVDAKFEGSYNHLMGLLWLHPKQIDIWSCFYDIMLLDTTCKTNRFNMIMCVVVCVDNHNRSCLVATALIIDEQKATF
ncbi:hypothetical protein C2G38_2166612 [Gigaspora rosea]|uniref:MULE transposase domain-containing protein n=1 Tax=Gigaspora rosea TaxID=44941 RepID=A0A397VRI5_9GLOM|nr:hypothetical protein C2G38_2166612 [Gigaspora rosea]